MPVDETFMTPFSGRKKSCCHFNNNIDYNLNYNALLFFMNTFIQGFENFPHEMFGIYKRVQVCNSSNSKVVHYCSATNHSQKISNEWSPFNTN